MEEHKAAKQGHKKKDQKYKSLLVWNLLLKRTDENHAAGIKEIQELLEDYGIEAERHSVSRDIKDLILTTKLMRVDGLERLRMACAELKRISRLCCRMS